MLAIPQISKPRLESRRVVFTDYLAVGNNICFAADGSPFAGRVKESNIDLRVRLQVVRFSRLGVGVED